MLLDLEPRSSTHFALPRVALLEQNIIEGKQVISNRVSQISHPVKNRGSSVRSKVPVSLADARKMADENNMLREQLIDLNEQFCAIEEEVRENVKNVSLCYLNES